MSGLIPLQRTAWALALLPSICWIWASGPLFVCLSAIVFSGQTLGQTQGQSLGQIDNLHQRIDGAAAADMPWLMAGPAMETQQLRRLSLDLRNTVPSLEEIDAYLAEPVEGRWARWVEKFLADPLHRERMVDWYDKTLLQRRA